MTNTGVLLPTAVFPTIQYMSKFLLYNEIWIEAIELYQKQTYRSRYEIAAANGKMLLSVPVAESGQGYRVNRVKLAYDTNWQRIHYKSIESAYRSTPFFEYYIDDFQRFFNQKHEFLLNYNMEILQVFCELLEISPTIRLTETFETKPEMVDLRYEISPKTNFFNEDKNFKNPKYNQVFGDKHGFVENLSFLDLLFNEGPNAYDVLAATIIK
ncbi:MAG TPA: hypothetical protein DCQ31_03375 [Bacteroidales bacterium]|nr:hypothetical protein [Bacteroidales bacterium]